MNRFELEKVVKESKTKTECLKKWVYELRVVITGQ